MNQGSLAIAVLGLSAMFAATGHAEVLVNGECRIEVGGQKIMDGPCYIEEEPADPSVRRVFDNYQEVSGDVTYDNFFMSFFGENSVELYYNGGGGATHAHALIGELPRLENGCYASDAATYCSWYYEAPD